MYLIVDANILFAALIKQGKTDELLFVDHLHLFAPEFILIEFEKYKKEILQKQSANMIILGACLRVAEEVVTKSSFAASIHENVPERFREANLKAFELGWSLGEHLKGVQEV